jgi:hypothetical protein
VCAVPSSLVTLSEWDGSISGCAVINSIAGPAKRQGRVGMPRPVPAASNRSGRYY